MVHPKPNCKFEATKNQVNREAEVAGNRSIEKCLRRQIGDLAALGPRANLR